MLRCPKYTEGKASKLNGNYVPEHEPEWKIDTSNGEPQNWKPNDYCPATEGNLFEKGYVVRCKLPETMSGKCTVGLVDYQRDWGGCIDLTVLKPGEEFKKVVPPSMMVNV